jgi:hypothetical protein
MSLKGGSDSLTWNGADLSMTGNIYASGGTIAGWDIGSNLTKGTGTAYIELNPGSSKIRIGAKASIDDSNDGVHIGDDGISLGTGTPFKVTAAGHLTANSATIGGWDVDGNGISKGNMTIASNTERISVGTDGDFWDSDNSFQFGGSNGISRSTSGDIIVGSDTYFTGDISAQHNFQVTGSTGTVTGSAVQFTGGDIAGWLFDTSKLYKQHASETRRIELDTAATIVDSTNHTGQQAISMTSGSAYNTLVQMSNIETFVNETDAYTVDEDYITITYALLATDTNMSPTSTTNYAVGGAQLVGVSGAGGGGEQE